MKIIIVRKALFVIFTFCILTLIPVANVFAGNDFLAGALRVDLPEVYNAGDYQILLAAQGTPNTLWNDYTSAWLGVDFANSPGPYGQTFSQVGLLTQADGIHWFVFTEAGANCLRGVSYWNTLGCIGSAGDIVSLNNWYKVEIVLEGSGRWVFRLYDTYNNSYDLAEAFTTTTRIYKASATEEEAYSVAADPYYSAYFDLYHPQYLTSSGFVYWPSSSGGNDNIIYATDLNSQNSFCPQYYGVNPNVNNDERDWYAGTGGQQCSWVLFPSSHVYLPLILNNS